MWEAHFYLRAADRYRSALYQCPEEVQPVGTKPWNDLVLDDFEAVLIHETDRRHIICSRECKSMASTSRLIINNGDERRARLRGAA